MIILADDLGYGDVGSFGATLVETPNIDRLAREGRRFVDAHSPSAVCSPSRYGLLTGRYAWRSKLSTWVVTPHDPLLIDTDRLTLPGLLQRHGYVTAGIGKWHLGWGDRPRTDWNEPLRPGPLEVGFDTYFGVPTSNNWPPFVYVENDQVVDRAPGERIVLEGEGNDVVEVSSIAQRRKDEEIGLRHTEKAVEFIEQHAEQPFFLYFATSAVHLPITPALHVQGSSAIGPYGDFVHELDWAVGEILETLDRLELAENTLLVFTSDNGALERAVGDPRHRPNGVWRGQKGDIYEGGHRVPFVARWPGRIPEGSVSEQLVLLTDLMATVASLLGVDLPEDAGPDSFDVSADLLGDGDHPAAPRVLHSMTGLFALREGSWKLIEGPSSGGYVDRPLDEVLQAMAQGEAREPVRLYDLAVDPQETSDLAAKEPARAEAMREVLDRIREATKSRRSP